MKFRIVSDLHLEASLFKLPKMEGEKDMVLILAGDIAPAIHLNFLKVREFFKDCAERHEKVFYVAGNHEHYGSFINETIPFIKKIFEEENINITLLDKDAIEYNDVMIIGATLWTDFDKQNKELMDLAKLYIADYTWIYDGGDKNIVLRPPKVLDMFFDDYNFIAKKFVTNTEKKKQVVITHHAPSYKSLHETYKFSNINGVFMSDLDSVIETYEPVLWVHGHTHNSFDYNIGNTRVVCNPRGYSRFESTSDENRQFNPKLVIEI